MATTAYLPVDLQEAAGPAAASPEIKQEEPKKKDPLYAAMFGTQIGSNSPTIGAKAARLDPSASGIDTLDEPVIETLVAQASLLANCRVEAGPQQHWRET